MAKITLDLDQMTELPIIVTALRMYRETLGDSWERAVTGKDAGLDADRIGKLKDITEALINRFPKGLSIADVRF